MNKPLGIKELVKKNMCSPSNALKRLEEKGGKQALSSKTAYWLLRRIAK